MHTTEISREVWDNFRAGNQAAFAEIYRLFVPEMFRFGRFFTDDRDLLQDCIHDVFINVFNRKDALRRDDFSNYLMTALRNELFKSFRDAKTTIQPEEAETELATVASPEDTYIENENRQQTHRQIQLYLAALTERQRQALFYRYIMELPFNKIQSIMGLNYQSVLNLVQRAINKIKSDFNI